MWSEAVEARWQELAEEVFTGRKEWRMQHPKATLREIEAALDERLSRVRARLLRDVALASAARNLRGTEPGERPACPRCGHGLEARGEQERTLTTYHDRTITLERSYAVCPGCEGGLFPPG